MAEIKVKEKLKEKIDRVRRKIRQKRTVGEVRIAGVEKPLKPITETKKPEAKDPKKKRTVSVGPKGGKFVVSSSGKKLYERGAKSQEAMTKSLLGEIIQETRFHEFFKSFKMKKDR